MGQFLAGLRAFGDTPVSVTDTVITTLVLCLIFFLIAYFVFLRKKAPVDSTATLTTSIPKAGWQVFVPLSAIVLMICWNLYLQRRIRHLEVETIRYVLPRGLTQSQIAKFGKYLSEHSKPHEVKIRWIIGDSESQRYAGDLSSAFTSGNWVPAMLPIDPIAVACVQNDATKTLTISCTSGLAQIANQIEGLSVMQTGPNPPPVKEGDVTRPAPLLITAVNEAFSAAGVSITNSGYSNNNDPVDTITVVVGFRARDKMAVIPPDFFRRMRQKVLDLDDDDNF